MIDIYKWIEAIKQNISCMDNIGFFKIDMAFTGSRVAGK